MLNEKCKTDCKTFFCLQELEEPGEDTSRFDIIVPTVVRPQKPDIVSSSENIGNNVDVSDTI